MRSLFGAMQELAKNGKIVLTVNKWGTTEALISPKKGVTVSEMMKILYETCPNAGRISFTEDGKLDLVPALAEDNEVKKEIQNLKAAKSIKVFVGTEGLILVGYDESGNWLSQDKVISWDKITEPIKKEPKKEEKAQEKTQEPQKTS